MKFRTTVLGVTAVIAFGVALVLNSSGFSEKLSWTSWGVAGALVLAWFLLNRQLVLSFLARKSTRTGANLALGIFLVFGILVFVNTLAKEFHWKKDFTRSGSNSLSEQSIKIARELPQEVKAFYFNNINEKEKGEDVLKRYAYASGKFKFEFVDTERRPTFVESMGVRRRGAVVLTIAGSNKKVTVDQPTEEQITNGLMKLLRSNEVSIYFTIGHNEHPLEGESDPVGFALLKSELIKQGYNVKELSLVSEGRVPADAALLIVGGPKKSFFPRELEILSDWIKAGGHALISLELDASEKGLAKGSRQIAEMLKPFGVQVMNEMLVDPLSQQAKVEANMALGFSGSKEHAITRDFPKTFQAVNFLFPLTTYLVHDEKSPYEITPLVTSSPKSWAESDWSGFQRGQVSLDPGKDRNGPLDLGYAVEIRKSETPTKVQEKKSKIVVYANTLFFVNSMFDKVENRDLILNSIAWLADDDRFISIRSKEEADSVRQDKIGMANWLLLFFVFLAPLLVVGVGIYQWNRRSRL